MAVRGILDREPSWQQLLGSGLGSGFAETTQKLMGREKKGPKPLGLGSMSKASKDLKELYGDRLQDEDYPQIIKKWQEFNSQNPGVDPVESLVLLGGQYLQDLEKEKEAKETSIFKGGESPSSYFDPGGAVSKNRGEGAFGALGKYFANEGDPLGRNVLEKNLAEMQENQQKVHSLLGKKPSQLLKEIPTGLSKLAEQFGMPQPGERAGSEQFGDYVREDLSEEEREAAENLAEGWSDLASMLMLSTPGKLKGKGRFEKTTRPPEPSKKTSPLKAGAEDEGLAREARPLKGRASKETPSKATEMRIERLKPEGKMYKPQEHAELRETQLKLVPKYEAEILKDAEERAARAADRVPKTAVGEAGQAKRAAAAAERMPKVQDAYHGAISRVRALEDQIAGMKAGPAKEQAQKMLDFATKELKEAEFELRQAVQNLRGESVRSGIPAMEKAAQDKLTKITDMARGNEPVKIAKMDYNPEHIRKANALKKGKKVPAAKVDDFYTQVHDTYVNQYKKRLGDLEKEFARASKNRSLSGQMEKNLLRKEMDAVQKMIDSAEAENVIHRHKLGLREMQARKKAAERFKSLKPSQGSEKAKKVSSQKMWKGKYEKAEGKAAKEKVVKDAVEEVAAQNPTHGEEIKKEGKKLNETLEDLKEKTDEIKTKTTQNPSATVNYAKEQARKIVSEFKHLKDNFPYLWRSRMGWDIIIGSVTALIDEFAGQTDMNISTSKVIGVFGGRLRGIPTRGLVQEITRSIIKEVKINNAEKLYKDRKIREFEDYSPSIKKKAKERFKNRR